MRTNELLLFVVFSYLAYEVHCHTGCNGELACPSDKPYCTEAGCVYECPEHLFYNGSTCVLSCKDLFVLAYNVSCIPVCPSGWFYKEKARAVGLQTFIDKICTEFCITDEYLFRNECVPACPKDFGYIDGQRCVQNCPDVKQFQQNFTVRSIPYKRCFDSCPNFHDGIYCTDQCKSNYYVFNFSCVENCPDTHPMKAGSQCVQACPETYIYQENKTCLDNCTFKKPFYFPNNRLCSNMCPDGFFVTKRRGVLYCEDRCKQGEVSYNRTCLLSCSGHDVGNTELYSFNNTCVSQCPTGYLSNDDITGRYCTDSCSEMKFLYQKSCVDLCPDNTYMVNSECIDICPAEHPYGCRVRKGQGCGEVCPPNDENFYSVCVEKCPFYRDENTCKEICPAEKYTSEDLCVTECPKRMPLKQTTHINLKKCEVCHYCYAVYRVTDKSELRTTCVSECREGLVNYNSTCQEYCPASYRYLLNGTCQREKCPNLMHITEFFNECADHCNAGEYVSNGTCVTSCPNGTFISNNTCTYDQCMTKYEYKEGDVTFCIDNCTSFGFVSNGSCVNTCPDVVFKNTCVHSCPETHRILMKNSIPGKSITYKECVNECGASLILFNNSCVQECPETFLLFNQSCVSTCPHSHPFRIRLNENSDTVSCTNICVDPFPLKDTKNWTCVDKCPSYANFVQINTCDDNCPDGYLQFETDQGIACSRKCPREKLEFNSTCIKACPSAMYNFSGITCVYNCTGELPFGLQNGQWRCIAACEDQKYFRNGQCISAYECQEPEFIYLKQCVSECPEYYQWANGCSSLLNKVFPVLGASIFIFIVIIIWSRRLLTECFSVLGMALLRTDVICKTRRDKVGLESDNNIEIEEDDDEGPLLRYDLNYLSEG